MSCFSLGYFVTDFSSSHAFLHAHLQNKSDSVPLFFAHGKHCPCVVAPSAPFVFPGHGGRDPTGSRRTTCKHENPGPQSEPEAPSLCEQPDPAQAETPGVTPKLGLKGQTGVAGKWLWEWHRLSFDGLTHFLVLLRQVIVAQCGFSAKVWQ